MEPTDIAPCGVNCAACSVYLDRKKPCPGCRGPVEKITRKSCRSCVKKKCAFEKGYTWCFECASFPCRRIKSLNERYVKHYDVDIIQNGYDAKNDMDAFLEAQKIRFTCKHCGSIIDQHHRRCSVCMAPV